MFARPKLAAVLSLALVAGALLVGAPANAGPATPDVPDVVVAGPVGEQKAWFPDVTRLDDGRLVTVFYQATQHSRDDGRYLWTESTDGGLSWSTPRVVLDTPEDDRDAQITQLSDGTILINWFRTDWTDESTTGAVILGSYVTRSTDGGATWTSPVQVESQMSCGCGAVQGAYRLGWAATTGKITELPNGDLLLPLYGTLPDSTVGQAGVVRSTDGGRTWPLANEAMIPVPAGTSLSEMALAATSDNGVTALLRTGGEGYSFQTDSTDGGQSWSMPVATSMKGQAHHILRLPGGELLTTYGDRSGQFQSNEPVVGRIRLPGGGWDDHHSVLLYRAGANVDQGDPSTVAVGDGRFFTVSYDENRGSIIGTFSDHAVFADAENVEQPVVAQPADGTVRSFDAERIGATPANCDVIGDVTIAGASFGGAEASNRAMRLSDQSNAVYTRAWCRYQLSTERSVSYRFSAAELNYGPIVAIQGGPGSSANGVWRFTLKRNGNDLDVTAYDGSKWHAVGTVEGGAIVGEWQTLTINATLDRAELILNGARFQTRVRNAASTGLGDIFFGSAGTSPGGVAYYIDDLAVAGELPDDAFAGVTVEPLFDDTGVTRGTEVVDAPVARFRLPAGADVSEYSASVQWRDETIPATLSGPDADGWVTASITHTFTRAGAGTLRTLITDAAGVVSVGAQQISIAGQLSTLTFDDDEVGSVPPDCSTLDGYTPATVSDQAAHSGEHSLRLHDTIRTASVGVTCTVVPQQGAYLSFRMNPTGLQGFTVDLIGRSLQPTGQPANSLFRLAVRAGGGIQWYEQWTATWRELAPAGTVPLGQWSQVELAVPVDNAAVRVSVDGAYVGSAGSTIGNNSSRHNEITGITGLAFTTGGSGAAGDRDDVFIDDVTFGEPSITPEAAVGTAPFTISGTSTIDSDGAQVGFPNPGVVVPNGDGQRILVPYSGHPDVDDAGGIELAASDDGGTTWTSAQELNPMEDTSGIQLTKLRNGDLLAVNFHTYMKPGSGDREAVVETAVSSDNGTSWTHRSGLMSTPEPMRPIGASERPGTTLGGFVVHKSVLEDPDGTLHMSGYGYYAADEGFRQIMLSSHDGGVNWSVTGTVATADPEQLDIQAYEGPCEGAIERLADGSLLMVMRVGWRLPMIYSRSTDNGVTWSEPKQIEVGPAGQDLLSVQPTLELLPTGELLLMVGRPGLVLTISESGRGDDWSVPVGIDYANSENGGFTVLDPTTVAVSGDRGRVAPWEVWSRQVSIDPPCERTITGAHDGPLTVGAGGLCLVDATVEGAVTVTGGGRLILQDSAVAGPVRTTSASLVSLCGSTIDGRVTLAGTTGTVAIGNTTSACAPSTIIGPLSVTGTAGQVVMDRSEVAGPVSISGNSAALATVLAGLTVHGPLSCSGNTVAPTDSGLANTIDGRATGQCAALK